MEANTLAVKSRKDLKKTVTKRLRKEGQIPAVVYGHKEPISISIDGREFEKKFHKVSENTIITLIEDGNDIADVLLKDYQEDITREQITHLDFYEVERGKKLKTKIPVTTEGSSIGVKTGGILAQMLHELNVECLPKDIPATIVVNVEALNIGDSIHLGDLPAIEGVKFLESEDQIVVHVVHTKAAEEVEEAEEAEAAPEESAETSGE
jgi:large subunit ribosomal protein L25